MRAVMQDEPGGPEVLRIADLPHPAPGTGEVRIRVQGAGVNRADLLQRQGRYPPPPGASSTIGLEASGIVDAVGPDVTGWRVGDPCLALLAGGGYAEFVVVPAGQLMPVPPGLPLVEAAALPEAAATVVSNLDLAHLTRGETFLVHGGAGGIGAFAVQYARLIGATALTTAGSAERLDAARRIGAHHAFSYHDDWPTAVREATDGRGVDVILDNMGGSYLDRHVRLLAPRGRLVTIGLQGGRSGPLDLGRLLSTWGTVTATSLRMRPAAEKAAICARVVEQVWPSYADGTLQPPTVTVFPLAEVAAAHQQLESGRNLGKIVLQVSEG